MKTMELHKIVIILASQRNVASNFAEIVWSCKHNEPNFTVLACIVGSAKNGSRVSKAKKKSG